MTTKNNIYKLRIILRDEYSELVDKYLEFDSLDEVRNYDLNDIANEAESFADDRDSYDTDLAIMRALGK